MRLDSEDANSFLALHTRLRRGLYHECYGEGCDFEEVEEVMGSNQRAVCLPQIFLVDFQNTVSRLLRCTK